MVHFVLELILLALTIALGTFGCSPKVNPLRTITAAIIACADGYYGKPDGRCGGEDDVPLQIPIHFEDIFGNPIPGTERNTDPNGRAELTAQVPSGNSIYLSYPVSIVLQGQLVYPLPPDLLPQSGTEQNRIIEIPFAPKLPPPKTLNG